MSEHVPVLLEEILDAFNQCEIEPKTSYLDGTFGRGGHLQAVLERFESVQATGFDQDPDAIQYGQSHFADEISQGRLRMRQCNFTDYRPSQDGTFDLMLLDLGVSSPQLDEAHRGFSFYQEGPLDMRMNPKAEIATAAELVNEASEEDLIHIFKTYGEIHRPFRVVRAIVHDRKETPYETTQQLSSLIERVDGWQRKGHHPATRYFMALRLAVNNELGVLEEALPNWVEGLNEGGRLAVLTFHSLEDRIVKHFFKAQRELGRPVNKKVIIASDEEQKMNPRARSAKLRIFERKTKVQ